MKKEAGSRAVFSELKSLLKPYESKLEVTADTKAEYCLNTRHLMENKQYLFFAAVKIGKTYVSFYLMPVYVFPVLLKNISPELKKRMQGKSCFNFKSNDEKLFKELSGLTKDGFNRFKKEKLILE